MSIFDDFSRMQSTINQMMGDFGRRSNMMGGGLGGGVGGGLGSRQLGASYDPFWDADIGGLGGWDMGMPGLATPLLTPGIGQQMPLLGKGEEESKLMETGGAGTALAQRGAGQLPVLRCRVNVEDQDKQYAVTAEVPGFDKENLKVNISDDNVLTISGEQKKEHVEESRDKRFLRSERSFGSVRRSLRLPRTIDKSNVQANYVNGILHINVPKKEEAVGQHVKIA